MLKWRGSPSRVEVTPGGRREVRAMSWFKNALGATMGFMTAQIIYIVVLLVLAGGCCLCLLVAMASTNASLS
jgi:hypothetical protein